VPNRSNIPNQHRFFHAQNLLPDLIAAVRDRGWTRTTTIASHLIIIAAFVLAAWADSSADGASLLSLALMGSSAVLLDVGITGDQTLARRAINLLQPEARGRINGLFVGLFFLGGAAGAAMVGIAWESGGWPIDLCPRRWLWHRSVGDRDYSCRRTRAERETLIGLLKKFGYMAAAASGQSKEEEKFC
jgi:hypothetical protein